MTATDPLPPVAANENTDSWISLNIRSYQLLSDSRHKDSLGTLAHNFDDFSDVVGYSALGDLFVRDPDTNEYAVVYLHRHGFPAKRYGPYDSVDRFESEVLEDPAFVDYCLKPDSVRQLAERVGELGDSEVYFPVPFPCLGGSGELSTYSKGNVWVYFDLLGQSGE